MRRSWPILMLFAMCGFLAAQDTNFSVGPQYLVNTNSPLLLHPIATPSMSLDAALAPTPTASTPEAAPPSNTFLGGVYWGDHSSSEIVDRRVSTPSMSPSDTALYMNAVAREVANQFSLPAQPVSEEQLGPSVIELSSVQPLVSLPASLLDLGVSATADTRSLPEQGFGSPLGDVAAYWKAHKRQLSHTYTNIDVDRLHGE